jgi:hypothetical protein
MAGKLQIYADKGRFSWSAAFPRPRDEADFENVAVRPELSAVGLFFHSRLAVICPHGGPTRERGTAVGGNVILVLITGA